MCAHVFLCVSICMHICPRVCGSQKSVLSVFFNHSPPCILRHGLSLNQEPTNLARRLTSKPQGSTCLSPQHWGYRCTTAMPSALKDSLSSLHHDFSFLFLSLFAPLPPRHQLPLPPPIFNVFLKPDSLAQVSNEIGSACRIANFAN